MKVKNVKLFVLVLFLVIGTFTGCKSQKFSAPVKLGGKWIPAQTLNQGHDVYMNNCLSCHGVVGDGKGPASIGQMPQPRNFQQGLFKFANVTSGELPRDEDLERTIRYGLRGTGMLPWDISNSDLHAVIQYLKTFSPAWRDKVPGEPIALTPDPWGPAHAQEAILQGEKIFHGLAQCYTCHPTYDSMDKISEYSKELTGNEIKSIRTKPYLSTLLDSSYNTKVMPPDFTKSFIKTGGEIPRIYELLGVGINGTAMPAWKGQLTTKGDEAESEKNQWAVAYYVNSLYQLKFDLQARTKFIDSLNERRAQHDRYDEAAPAATVQK